MKYVVPSILFFLLIFSCSDSDAPIKEPEEKASLPTLTTTSVSGITESSAISGGNITENGGANITARGIVWSTSSEPTISDNKTANATGTGEFSGTLEGLEGNTTYYLRAYATNSEGTAYGNEFSFTTLEKVFIENIYEGDVILKNQNDIDLFVSQKYTSITGELQILGTEEPFIEDVGELKSIRTIGKNLVVSQLNSLIDFNGLENLISVAGSIIIKENQNLEKIEGFSKLQRITSGLIIKGNSNLSFVGGFTQLEGLEVLSVEENDNLKGLGSLELIPEILGGIFINDNKVLEHVAGFSDMESTRVISISDNEKLFSITGFDGIKTIRGDFSSALNLKNISALSIINNSSLVTLEAFSKLAEVRQDLIFRFNSSIEQLSGFNNLLLVGGRLELSNNEKLENIDGFIELEKVIVDLDVSSNLSLLEFPPFENLSSIGSNLRISDNQNLRSVKGFNSLIEQNRFLFITNNASLKSIEGFDALITKDFQILIGTNKSLEKLDCFKSLEFVNGIAINDCVELNNFCNFQRLIDSGWNQFLNLSGNGYNPTYEDLVAGNCKL